jgi:ankyrin repeat protein
MSSLAAVIDAQLYTAAGNRDVEATKQLIKAGAYVNAPQPPCAQAAIHIAPKQGIELVKLLVDNGADIHLEN